MMTDKNVTPATDEQATSDWLSGVRKYVHERGLMSHKFGDEIHWLHAGTEREATLTLATLREMIARIDADAKVIEELRAVAERLARAAGVPADAVKVR